MFFVVPHRTSCLFDHRPLIFVWAYQYRNLKNKRKTYGVLLLVKCTNPIGRSIRTQQEIPCTFHTVDGYIRGGYRQQSICCGQFLGKCWRLNSTKKTTPNKVRRAGGNMPPNQRHLTPLSRLYNLHIQSIYTLRCIACLFCSISRLCIPAICAFNLYSLWCIQ